MSTNFASTAGDLAPASDATDLSTGIRGLAVWRRRWRSAGWVCCVLAAAIGFGLAFGAFDLLRPLSQLVRAGALFLAGALVLATVGWAIYRIFHRRSLLADAIEVQTQAGAADNSMVTFVERTGRGSAPTYILTRLKLQAITALDRIDRRRLVSKRPVQIGLFAILICVLVTVGLWLIAPVATARGFQRIVLLRPDGARSGLNESALRSFHHDLNLPPSIQQLSVRVVPPAYSGLPPVEIPDDQPIRVLAGSRLELALATEGPVNAATYGFAGMTQPLRSDGAGEFTASLIADKSGALELHAAADTPQPIVPIVRAVEVFPDAPPEVHLTEPVKDQVWTTVPSAPVALRWNAKDDLGLAQVTVKYIKSRGNGDSATFVNGVLSAGAVQQSAATEWSGGTSIDLARMQMQPGDTLVVWAEARDRRPGTEAVVRSSSIALAVAAPELAKINLGGLGPTELAKYLLSERMILLHAEKLQSDRPRLTADELKRRAFDIESEQRDFRTGLGQFTTFEGAAGGGQLLNATGQMTTDPGTIDQQVQALNDERNEIHRHGIPEAPQGAPAQVRDLIESMNAMADAEDSLGDIDTQKAVGFMRIALTKLKSAQAAERYIPPVKATTQPIDLKRRYAGELAEIKTKMENLARQPESAESRALRSALTELYAALGQMQNAPGGAVTARNNSIAQARERVSAAADRLAGVSGDHSATIALSLGQLRIVEAELARLDANGAGAEFGVRMAKPLNLLLQATSGLFGIVEARVQSATRYSAPALPTQGARSAAYFRRLQ